MIPQNIDKKEDLLNYLLDIGFKKDTPYFFNYILKNIHIELLDDRDISILIDNDEEDDVYEIYSYIDGISLLNELLKYEFRKKKIAELLK